MADQQLQTTLNSGDLTSIYLGGVTTNDKLLKKSEIDAGYTAVATTTALDARVTTNEADILTNATNITTNANGIATNVADILTNTNDIVSIGDRVTELESSHSVLLNATSTASSQQPTALDIPLQIEFGAAQTTTDIDISVTGAITFKTAGKYIIAPFFQYGRVGSSGVSQLLNRYLVNGVQAGNTLAAKIDNAETLVPWSSSIQFTANTNDVLTIEIMRDSIGTNSGGLFSATPTAAGWNLAPCASIQIYKAT